MSKSIDVYGIGNPLIDVLARVDDEELEELELTKGTMQLIDTERGNYVLSRISDREKTYSCGGSAPNTMITLSSLGISNALAGMIGDDELGEIYQKRLQEQKVISDLKIHQGDTGSCIVLITKDHERTMSTRLGVCQNFSVKQVNHQKIAQAKYLYFTGYMWDTDSQKEALQAAMDTAKKSDTKVVFDVADPFAVERHRDDFLRLLKEYADVVLANRDEAKILLGCNDVAKAAKELSEYCNIAAVKNGASGSCIAYHNKHKQECVTAKAYPIEAVDSTGAGDNYAAGFLYGLVKGFSIADTGKIASYVAAQIVQQTGAQFDQQNSKELLDNINQGSF